LLLANDFDYAMVNINGLKRLYFGLKKLYFGLNKYDYGLNKYFLD
jgi:hypothetical protein